MHAENAKKDEEDKEQKKTAGTTNILGQTTVSVFKKDEMTLVEWDEYYDGSYAEDRIKLSELVGLKTKAQMKYDTVNTDKDLFEITPHNQDIMAIFDIINQTWFQNLVWRLREFDEFDMIKCLNTFPHKVLDRLVVFA